MSEVSQHRQNSLFSNLHSFGHQQLVVSYHAFANVSDAVETLFGFGLKYSETDFDHTIPTGVIRSKMQSVCCFSGAVQKAAEPAVRELGPLQ